MHARSHELAKWLTAQARDRHVREPTAWHYGLHHKDAKGRLLTQGLPFVEGIRVGPKRWREELNPEHQRPEKKHQQMTAEERLTRIDAFEPETLRELEKVRASVTESWEIMNAFW